MSEDVMIKNLLEQISNFKSIKKVFMNKRDVKIYDNSWQNIQEQRTEYDVDIIASIIDRYEWRQLMALEKDFDERFPMFKFNYHLIESDAKTTSNKEDAAGKLIYDAESITKIQE